MDEQKTGAELWRAIPDWPYEASNLGRVRNAHGRIMKLRENRSGYLFLMLCHKGKHRRAYVAWCVATAFFGPRPDGLQVAHLDGAKANNTPSNLAYVTRKENERHKVLHGTRKRKLSDDQVRELRTLLSDGGTIKGLARRFGADPWTVKEIKFGRLYQVLASDLPRAALQAGSPK